MTSPNRGEIRLADLDPTRGREQRGRRPVLVVSVDRFNSGPAGLVIVIPLTSRDRSIPSHVPIDTPEGGVRERSFVMCEQVRAIARDRLTGQPFGTVGAQTLAAIEERLRFLLGL